MRRLLFVLLCLASLGGWSHAARKRRPPPPLLPKAPKKTVVYRPKTLHATPPHVMAAKSHPHRRTRQASN